MIDIRAYLRRINPPPVAAYDEFLGQTETLFKLRVRAEERFKARPHSARSVKGALPLDWSDIREIVSPREAAPPENVVTQFARDDAAVLEEILVGMRKVLVRRLQKVNLGLVQQVDANCLRWLVRQPGRDGIEKAGPSQRILAVVRREEYNTLENRVFKDFLIRLGQEAAMYIRKHEGRFRSHETLGLVRRLRQICEEGLAAVHLEAVGEIRELPVPNYVLRQDRRYAKVWNAYVELVRQAAVAESLWARREDVANTIEKLGSEALRQTSPSARFHAPIWFNPLDGKHPILDRPFYENEMGSTRSEPSPSRAGDDVVIDLTGGSIEWDLLIYGSHANSKPYLQDYRKPSIEDLALGKAVYLDHILIERNAEQLKDFLEQLYGRVGGKRWFVLIPDDWDALWQEAVINAVPLSRNNIVLVWRSIAAAISVMPRLSNVADGEDLVIVDIQGAGEVRICRLTLTRANSASGFVPQRKAYTANSEHHRYRSFKLRRLTGPTSGRPYIVPRCDRFSWPPQWTVREVAGCARHRVLIRCGGVEPPDAFKDEFIILDQHALCRGVEEYQKKRSLNDISFYDELEALSLVVQTDDENLVAKPLVPPNEKWPGGRVMETPLIERAAVLAQGESYIDFLLCMGALSPDKHLRVKRHIFGQKLAESQRLDLSVRMIPGQGMAHVAVHAGFLREPIELDFLNGMSDRDESGKFISLEHLELSMLRSFPPEAPHVVADAGLWNQVERQVRDWILGRPQYYRPNGDWFAHAEDLYPPREPLPHGVKPIERLRRKNVFGNAPDKSFPTSDDFTGLFERLRDAYDRAKPTSETDTLYADVVRLIAWTYQSNNELFRPVRDTAVKRILQYSRDSRGARPLPQEYTLCANLCSTVVEWRTLWAAVKARLGERGESNNVDEELRLLYNLLQFHPLLLFDTNLYQGPECWDMMKLLIQWYERYNTGGPVGSKRIGYVLKCILYLLRCRKFDGKQFVHKEHQRARYTELAECLRWRPIAPSKRELHRVLCDYLDGRGTIAGIPTS